MDIYHEGLVTVCTFCCQKKRNRERRRQRQTQRSCKHPSSVTQPQGESRHLADLVQGHPLAVKRACSGHQQAQEMSRVHRARPVGVGGSRHRRGEKPGPQELGFQGHCRLLRHLCRRQSGAWETCLRVEGAPGPAGCAPADEDHAPGLTALTTLQRGAGPEPGRWTRRVSGRCP